MRRPKLKYKQDYESDSEEEDEQKLHHIAKYSIICLTIFIFCMGLLFAGIHFSLNQVGKLKGRHDDSTSNHLGWLTSELEVVSHQLTRSREYIIAAKGILHSNWMQDTTHHGDGVTKAPPLSIPKEQQQQQQQPPQQQQQQQQQRLRRCSFTRTNTKISEGCSRSFSWSTPAALGSTVPSVSWSRCGGCAVRTMPATLPRGPLRFLRTLRCEGGAREEGGG